MIDRWQTASQAFFIFFWWKNSTVCSRTEHFQQFKTPQLPFYFPMAPQNHVYTWCFSTVCRITQGSVRRCRSLTPSLSRKHQALSSAHFSNKNNNGKVYLRGFNRHSIQIIRLVHTPEQNLKHAHFRNGFRAEQISGDNWSQSIYALFCILAIHSQNKK